MKRELGQIGVPSAASGKGSTSSFSLNPLAFCCITIVPISTTSYRECFRQQNLINNPLDTSSSINSLIGETETENASEATEFSLARLDNQIERIKPIITSALRNRASDIHLEPTEAGLQVRYRIDGISRHITTLLPDYSRKVIVALKVMCEMDIADSRRPQDGQISEQYTNPQQEEQGLDLRVSTLPCVSSTKGVAGEKAVLRLLRQQNSFQTIDDLGFSDRTRATSQMVAAKSSLVSGSEPRWR